MNQNGTASMKRRFPALLTALSGIVLLALGGFRPKLIGIVDPAWAEGASIIVVQILSAIFAAVALLFVVRLRLRWIWIVGVMAALVVGTIPLLLPSSEPVWTVTIASGAALCKPGVIERSYDNGWILSAAGGVLLVASCGLDLMSRAREEASES